MGGDSRYPGPGRRSPLRSPRHSPGEDAPTGIAEGVGRPVARTWDLGAVLDYKACGMKVHWVQGISMADVGTGASAPGTAREPVV